MSYVSSLLERWIGPDATFRSQRELAEQAGIQPSTLNGTLKAKFVQPETLAKLLSCMAESQQDQLIVAAVKDIIPEPYINKVLDNDSFVVRHESIVSTLSPLAQTTLTWLNRQAAKDNEAQAWLEQLGRWVGLDKELND